MAKNSYQVWTSDMVIGAAIVVTGIIATLVRRNILVLKWSVSMPPLVAHLWPLLLIGMGLLLLLDREERRATDERNYAGSGERR